MKAAQGHIGRIFVLRLEDGDKIPHCIEQFAESEQIRHAQVILLGGLDGGQVVVGPRYSAPGAEATSAAPQANSAAPASPPPPAIDPMLLPVDGAHEVEGVGFLAPNSHGKPMLHIHASLGRGGRTLTGCLRPGVDTWLVGEAVLIEILGLEVARLKDPKSGFELLCMPEAKPTIA